MNTLNRVVWHEGMFLTPHHLHARDASTDYNLHLRFVQSHFENWGVSELILDTEKLKVGTIAVNKCSGIMKDGLIFIAEGTSAPPSRQIEANDFPASLDSLDVHLAIRESSDGNNTWMPKEDSPSVLPDDATRFVASLKKVPDDISYADSSIESERKAIFFGEPKFKLLLGAQSSDGYTTMRIAQVVRQSKFATSPRYVAPCLKITASKILLESLTARLDDLAERSRTLDSRRQEGAGIAGFSTPEDFLLLQTLTTFIPRLSHACKVAHPHPECVYALLLELAGALCAFSRGADPAKLPNYSHEDLGGCFAKLDYRIEELLNFSSKAKYVEVALLREGQFWYGDVNEPRFFKNSKFFLSVRTDTNIAGLLQRTPQVVKIASKEKVKLLYQRAGRGLPLKHESVPPPGIPAKPGSQHFLLLPDGETPLWGEIKKDEKIGIFLMTESISNPEVHLFIELE